jgi:hypothetical protein
LHFGLPLLHSPPLSFGFDVEITYYVLAALHGQNLILIEAEDHFGWGFDLNSAQLLLAHSFLSEDDHLYFALIAQIDHRIVGILCFS